MVTVVVLLFYFISFNFLKRFPGCKDGEDKKTKWLNPKDLAKRGQNKSEAIVFFKGVKHLRID